MPDIVKQLIKLFPKKTIQNGRENILINNKKIIKGITGIIFEEIPWKKMSKNPKEKLKDFRELTKLLPKKNGKKVSGHIF